MISVMNEQLPDIPRSKSFNILTLPPVLRPGFCSKVNAYGHCPGFET
jgi:hypothetical protein